MKKHSHIWKILIFDMFVIEFGPVGVFFVAYYLSSFYIAAMSLAVATFVSLIASKIINKRVPTFAIFSGTITIVTAFITYYFKLPEVLIFKDTVYYLFFASLLFVSIWKKKALFKTFFGHIFAIEENGWFLLEKRWLIFFILAGASNEFVRIFLSLDEWVVYKQIVVFFFLGFGLYQFKISSEHRLPEADKLGLRKLREHDIT
jgi:intracellular septation protein